MTYLTSHAGWIAALICYLAFILWLTYEAHIAPTEEQDPTDITIDDLIN